MTIINLEKNAEKFLSKLEKSNPKIFDKILLFLYQKLSNCDNPCNLPNAKKLQGFLDNRYRWRIGDYRIIGIVRKQKFMIIEIIKIAHRQEVYKA